MGVSDEESVSSQETFHKWESSHQHIDTLYQLPSEAGCTESVQCLLVVEVGSSDVEFVILVAVLERIN